MITTFAKVARWSDIRELFSGNLLKLFPPRAMASIIGSVVEGMSEEDAQLLTRARLSERGRRLGLRLEVADGSSGISSRSAMNGDDLLKLYFTQIFTQDAMFLDLRSSAFDGTVWRPGRLFVQWDPDFLRAVRRMYTSFYHGSESEFDEAVAELGLAGHADLFRGHFGENQEAVEFQTESFRKIFEAILSSHNQSLPPSFGLLGVYLICLYEHLEYLGGSYNVRQAFDDVVNVYGVGS